MTRLENPLQVQKTRHSHNISVIRTLHSVLSRISYHKVLRPVPTTTSCSGRVYDASIYTTIHSNRTTLTYRLRHRANEPNQYNPSYQRIKQPYPTTCRELCIMHTMIPMYSTRIQSILLPSLNPQPPSPHYAIASTVLRILH